MPKKRTARDPSRFDLGAFLTRGPRTETVYLYPRDDEYAKRLAELERQGVAAERMPEGNRGLDDPSPEQVLLQVEELKAERQASAVPITIRALRDVECAEVGERAAASGVKDPRQVGWWLLAEAIEDKTWTPETVEKLAVRDREGEALVAQMIAAYNEVMAGPSAPFSPAS